MELVNIFVIINTVIVIIIIITIILLCLEEIEVLDAFNQRQINDNTRCGIETCLEAHVPISHTCARG